jgi:hypothetical protein
VAAVAAVVPLPADQVISQHRQGKLEQGSGGLEGVDGV